MNQKPIIIAYTTSNLEINDEQASALYLSTCDPNISPIQSTTFTQALWSQTSSKFTISQSNKLLRSQSQIV